MTDQDGVTIYQTPGEVKCFTSIINDMVGKPGKIVEVGVYMGATAKILSKTFPNKDILLFDTFAGFPNDISVENGDATWYKVGDMNEASLGVVKKNLSSCENVKFYEGRFPDTARGVDLDGVLFAHIDVDIYKAMKESLEYLYPKTVSGGVILLHDYPAHRGVKKAVDDFMKDKPEKVEIVGAEGRQAKIIKQ